MAASAGTFLVAVASTKAERRSLFSTFGYLVATQGATAVLGLAYWPLSTHLFPAANVGIAAAASSTAMLLASLGVLGISTLLLAEIRTIDPAARGPALSTGVAVGGVAVVMLSLGAVVLSPLLGRSLHAVGRDPLTALLFVIGSAATVAAATLDSAAIGLRRGGIQLTRGVVASGLKIVLVVILVVVGLRSSSALVFAWAAGVAISVPVAMRRLRLDRGQPAQRTVRARVELARRYGVMSLNHHVLNLAINAVSFILPVVAALLVAPREMAYFSTAQVLSSTLMVLPYMFAYALFAETATDEQLLNRLVRRTFPLSLATCSALILGVLVFAPVGLRLFGPDYATHGSDALRLLVAGGLPYVVKDHYVAIRRAQRRLATGAKVLAFWTFIETAAGALGGVFFGLNGLCAGWALAATAEAFGLLPTVVSVLRRPVPAGAAGSETAV